jgi:methylenetetrahydrofolate dehydrogenase (NADP+)/methenyltetrahydrofolate cyclohydrolase
VQSPAVSELAAMIDRLNADPAVNGIIVQLPLPPGVDVELLLARITPAKDIDGLGLRSPFTTAGPRGIMELLEAHRLELTSTQAVVVGTGRLMGAPLVDLLRTAGADVEVFNLERPIDLAIMRRAKLIISATGQPMTIASAMISPGSVVIDATGYDTDPALQQRTDIKITPLTGGVGPMTVAALFENLLDANENQLAQK